MSDEEHDLPPEEAPLEEAPQEAAPEPPGGNAPEPVAQHAGHPEDHADEHAKPHGHGKHAEHASAGPGAPLWMLSFADMMTLTQRVTETRPAPTVAIISERSPSGEMRSFSRNWRRK